MRVLLAPASYPPVLGGLQTVTHTLACQFLEAGQNVQVVTNRYPRALPGSERLEGVPVRRWLFLAPECEQLKRGRLDHFLASLVYYPIVRRRFVWLARRFQPEVVNVHFPDAQIPVILALRRRFDFRLVVSLHGDEIERWFTRLEPLTNGLAPAALRRLRAILRQADAVTACSVYLLEKAVSLEPAIRQKGHVIHNGIDLARFQDKTAFAYPRPYILAFGRFTQVKGFDVLLSAFARVASNHTGIDLILVGEGVEGSALKIQAAQSGISERVTFLGQATPEEVVRLLNGCRFVVVPSRRESFGLTALEAMAAGRLVLATRVGGLPEFLRQPPNCLVEPNIGGLVEGLKTLLALENVDRTGALNRSLVERFNWSYVAARYLEVFQHETVD